MAEIIPQLGWLSDPSVFRVNRLDAHSDHRYYLAMEEALADNPMTLRHSLNGSWKFSYAMNIDSRPEHFHEPDFNSSGWSDIQVPGHIQLQGFGHPHYVNTMYPWDGIEALRPPEIPQKFNAVGSYLKTFTLPEGFQEAPVYISFQGVESAFYVWLNGHFIGYSEDSFTPSEFELTPFVQEGQNVLAVQVFQRSTGSWLEDQDFWRFSGIFRDVYLYTVPKQHVRDLWVRGELDDTFTQGTVKAELEVWGMEEAGRTMGPLADGSARPVAVSLRLLDADGQVVTSAEVPVHEGKASVQFEAGQVKTWSAEQPYLYRLCLSVRDETGAEIEAIVQKIGFRRFEMDLRLMKLNGKRIVFKGVNRHEFNCRTGRAISKEDMLWDIRTLKRNNINAVRTSHYPNQSLWYELCDEYGVYVIDEMNLETHGSWQKLGAVEPSWNIPGDNPEWEEIVMDRAVSMLERDKNHPSVLIWSCGNESYAGQVILNVSHYFRKRDPSRLVHYEGVFHNRKYDAASDMESRMYAKPADIEAYLCSQPQKPYISCEYMHAMGNSVGGMHKYTELERKYPLYQGGFIWDYLDQALVHKNRYGEEYLAYGGDFGDRPTDYNFCGDGLVFADRTESPKLQEVKFLYQNLKLQPERGGIRISNENLFAGTEGLELRYCLLHEGTEISAGQLEVQVQPQTETFVELTGLEKLLSQHGPGEYALQASFHLKEAAPWAEAGFETAFGQYIFSVEAVKGEGNGVSAEVMGDTGYLNGEGKGAPNGAAICTAGQSASRTIEVTEGDVNIGITGRNVQALFSKAAGSLVSLRYSGREMIETPPYPLFWRATTDNDKGTAMSYTAGVWLAASLARKCLDIRLTRKDTASATVTFEYGFSIHPEIRFMTAYTVYEDGQIHVKSIYKGAEGLPNLPTAAWSFKMNADYGQTEWLALGPEENYADRMAGARLGWFQRPVSGLPSPYLMSQESGGRTGVRVLRITDAAGRGLEIKAAGQQPLECGVSPYTAFELENAAHWYELPPVHYTVVTVAGRQMGVGGDDSWGAPVHPEYQLEASRDLEFEFTLSPVQL